MENKAHKENVYPTPVSPMEDPRKRTDKPTFKETDEPWKRPGEEDRPKPDLEKQQEIKTG